MAAPVASSNSPTPDKNPGLVPARTSSQASSWGLRLQLIVTLTIAFIIAFVLLGVVTIQLGAQVRMQQRRADGQVGARAIAAALGSAPTSADFNRAADSIIGETVRGVELSQNANGDPPVTWVRGVTGLGLQAKAPLAGSGEIRVWLRPPTEDNSPLNNLLVLYFAVTGAAILLLTYLVLTVRIVRPIERITQASERVANGNLDVELPLRGAAEVNRLAASFAHMTQQLKGERQALEERLQQLENTTRDLRSAQQQVERSAHLAAVGRLAAGVAHEIGNPLAAILGLVELVRDEADESSDEFLARIQSETERIHKIIRELLDFARQEPAEDDRASASLETVIGDAIALVIPQKDAGRLRLERRLADVERVRGHADQLLQVILNLLLNACDAVGGEGNVLIELAEKDDGAFLVVSDSGPGIDPEILNTLFEPFVTTKRAGDGTGLGLAVSHTIVQRIGGRIEAHNNADGGARFELWLPYTQSTNAAIDES